MSASLKMAGRWGGIFVIIALVITLLRQVISLVGFLLFALKAMIVIAFVGLVLLMIVLVLRGRSRNRGGAEDI
jgi:hypothetical protein